MPGHSRHWGGYDTEVHELPIWKDWNMRISLIEFDVPYYRSYYLHLSSSSPPPIITPIGCVPPRHAKLQQSLKNTKISLVILGRIFLLSYASAFGLPPITSPRKHSHKKQAFGPLQSCDPKFFLGSPSAENLEKLN